MKTIFAILTTVAFGLVALPEKAEARPYYIGYSNHYAIGKTSCGCKIYQRSVLVGYDCHDRPIYRYYSVPVKHHCRSHYRSHHQRSYNHNYGHRTRYYDHRYRGHRGHSSVNFRTRHGSVRICR